MPTYHPPTSNVSDAAASKRAILGNWQLVPTGRIGCPQTRAFLTTPLTVNQHFCMSVLGMRALCDYHANGKTLP